MNRLNKTCVKTFLYSQIFLTRTVFCDLSLSHNQTFCKPNQRNHCHTLWFLRSSTNQPIRKGNQFSASALVGNKKTNEISEKSNEAKALHGGSQGNLEFTEKPVEGTKNHNDNKGIDLTIHDKSTSKQVGGQVPNSETVDNHVQNSAKPNHLLNDETRVSEKTKEKTIAKPEEPGAKIKTTNGKMAKNVFASAHEEFQELLKNPSMEFIRSGSAVRRKMLDGKRPVGDKETVAAGPMSDREQESSTDRGTGRRKLEIGMQFETEIQFTYEDLISFGKLSRDWNPVHYYADDGRVQHLSKIFRIRPLEEIEGKVAANHADSETANENLVKPSIAETRPKDINTLIEKSDVTTSAPHKGLPKSVPPNLGPPTPQTEPSTSRSEDITPRSASPDRASTDRFSYSEPIIPGALLNNIISGIMGSHLPGPGTLILSQSLDYKSRVFVNERVRVRVRVINVRKMLVTACYKAWVTREGKRVEVLGGDAKLVWRR